MRTGELKTDDDRRVTGWLAAMTRGIEERVDLVSFMLPRVAPEYLVVAAAAESLHRSLEGSHWVHLEHAYAYGHAKGKCDLVVVREGEAPREHFFEFKVLWPNGERECLDKVGDDIRKVSVVRAGGGPAGFAVVFAYEIDTCSVPYKRRLRGAHRPLKAVLETARERFGAPFFASHLVPIGHHDMKGSAQLLAWSAEATEGSEVGP